MSINNENDEKVRDVGCNLVFPLGTHWSECSPWVGGVHQLRTEVRTTKPVSYTHLTLPTKRIV